MQAYHLFHTSCLLHWTILCQYEMLNDEIARKGKSNRGRKAKNAPKRSKITSIVCPECQGTGIHVNRDELEKPSISLSEVWSTYSLFCCQSLIFHSGNFLQITSIAAVHLNWLDMALADVSLQDESNRSSQSMAEET
jgi:hypothetical protein